MDVRVDNFLDFCKIFYPSRYRLEMKKPGFNFSLLEAEVRENGGIDVNNIFFNGFCVEETDKLDFDNFDIEKQLAKLDNDLDKAKYLINCFDFIFRMPLLPFLPEKDLSVEPYYTYIEMFRHILKTKIFGINLFEKIYFLYSCFSNNLYSSKLYAYTSEIGLNYIVHLFSYCKIYENYKENNNNIEDNAMINYFGNFFQDTWFFYLINGNFTSKVINNEYVGEGEVFYCNFSYIGAEQKTINNINVRTRRLFENDFELFKKNKLFLNQELFFINSSYNLVGDSSQEYFLELTFKYSDSFKSSFKINIENIYNITNVYVPLPLTENINTKTELKNYRKKVLKNGFSGPYRESKNRANKNGGYLLDDKLDGLPLSSYIFDDFVIFKIIPKNPEQANSNIDFNSYLISKNIYGLIEKKDFINTDTNLFTERFINKAKRYLMRNRNDKLFESVPNEMIEQVIERNTAT